MSWWSSIGTATRASKDIRIDELTKSIRGPFPCQAIDSVGFNSCTTNVNPPSDALSPPFHVPLHLTIARKKKNQLKNYQRTFRSLKNRSSLTLRSPDLTTTRWRLILMLTGWRMSSEHPFIPPLKRLILTIDTSLNNIIFLSLLTPILLGQTSLLIHLTWRAHVTVHTFRSLSVLAFTFSLYLSFLSYHHCDNHTICSRLISLFHTSSHPYSLEPLDSSITWRTCISVELGTVNFIAFKL